MRISRPVVSVVLSLFLPLAQAMAQTCHGSASFASGMFRLGVGADFFDGGTSYAGHGALGAAKSWYATALVGSTKFNGASSSRTDLGATLGYQIPLGDPSWEFCPFGLFNYGSISGGQTKRIVRERMMSASSRVISRPCSLL